MLPRSVKKGWSIPPHQHRWQSRHCQKEEKTWDQIVPPQYHKWKKVFSEEEAKWYLKHQPWNIAIDFTKEAPKILDCKIYPLSLEEQQKLDKYIKENLEKVTYALQSLSTHPHSSLWGKRMANSGQLWTTGSSIPSLSVMFGLVTCSIGVWSCVRVPLGLWLPRGYDVLTTDCGHLVLCLLVPMSCDNCLVTCG